MSPYSWQRSLDRLSERDLAVLDDVERFRLLTTRQIQRLHFPSSGRSPKHQTEQGATRATLRVLHGLEEQRLIARLEHRIGGVRHGSQGIVWQLAPAGSRVQYERRGERGRHRFGEPSLLFVGHTLAVSELGVQLRELERDGQLEILQMETEPECWREFQLPTGARQWLKPDLMVVTASAEYEDHWYLEADRSSEHLTKIVKKAAVYTQYAATGIEQERRGKVFPRVLWVAPDPLRELAIHGAIASDKRLPGALFSVTTAEQFTAFVTGRSP